MTQPGRILFDCSPPVSAKTPVWPGDVPYSLDWTLRIGPGTPVNLSAIRSTVHLASHADAPKHYRDDGSGMDECPLGAFIGPARLIAMPETELVDQRRISAASLAAALDRIGGTTPPRVLVRTGTFDVASGYNDSFASFHPAAIDLLAERGVILVGVDTPSVDPFSSKELPSHHRLAVHGMMNLEGLALTGIPVGDYELIALPLRLVGADASPVRAVLRALS